MGVVTAGEVGDSTSPLAKGFVKGLVDSVLRGRERKGVGEVGVGDTRRCSRRPSWPQEK